MFVSVGFGLVVHANWHTLDFSDFVAIAFSAGLIAWAVWVYGRKHPQFVASGPRHLPVAGKPSQDAREVPYRKAA